MANRSNAKADKSPAMISGLYVLLSILWILFSDKLVEAIAGNSYMNLSALQTFKGTFFVTATGVMLYLLVKSRLNLLKTSEERFRALSENSPDIIMRFDRKHRHLYVNSAIEKLTGIKAIEYIGKTHFELKYPANLCQKLSETIDNVFITKNSSRIEFQLPWGSWTDWIFSPEFSDTEEVATVIATVRDITANKEAANALEASEKRYRALFESTGDGVLLFTKQSVYDCNEQAVKLFECSDKETIIGRHPAQLFPENDNDSMERALEKIESVLYGKPIIFDWKHKTFKGSVIDVSVSLSIIDTKSHTFIATLRDITELRRTQEQLRQSQKMQAVGQLAGGIAHDFNNVLGAIIGYADLLFESLTANQVLAGYAKNILSASDRAKHLVSQILTFSRQGPEQKSPANLCPIVKEVIELLRVTLPSTINLVSNIKKDTCSVLADSSKIHETIMNLATNAVYAMNEKGTLTITLLEKVIKEEVNDAIIGPVKPGFYSIIEVQDTGSGIDASIMSRIFEPFYTTKGENKGTGLGLSVVYGVMQSHHGNIQVESIVGQGTLFRLFLPKSSEKTAPDNIVRLPVPIGHERILLVDDESFLAEMGKQMLTSLGYKVTISTDSRKALRILKDKLNEFDLLITDQTMPHISGIELVKAVLEIAPDFPIILCTGFSTKVDEEKAEEIGCCDFAVKPLTMRTLAEKVRNALDVSKNKQVKMI
ncbi:MAG TPA: PAS domain S-box protein [Chitinispirillaceae bacterium]|nr:PAS domain S-box protein [Chitinispirillaceae bacterium]